MPWFKRATKEGHEFHDNVSGEIAALTEKAMPVDADLLLIEDSAASNSKKKVQWSSLPSGGGGGGRTLLDQVTLTSDSSNIEIGSIPTGYTQLIVEARLRSDRSANGDDFALQVGNTSVDTGSNYRYAAVRLGTSSENLNSGASDTKILSHTVAAAASSASGEFGWCDLTIYDYLDTSFNRKMTWVGGSLSANGSLFVVTGNAEWRDTSSTIDIIRLTPETGGNWVTGSDVKVYGVP